MKILHPVSNRLPMGLREPHRQAKIAARTQGFHVVVYAAEKKNLEKTGRKTKIHWDKRHDLTENVVL